MDDLLEEAVNVCIQYDRASASLLQRRLSIGYARAARIIDQLESTGVLSTHDGSSKPREVLIKSIKEYKEKNKEVLNRNLKNEAIVEVKEYNPKVCDFLPEEVKSLKNVTDLPYLKNNFIKIGNLIVTGNVISKKYEYIKTYLLFLLSKFDLNDVRLIIDDDTGVLKSFNSIPHPLTPVVTNFEKRLSSLYWLSREMDRRIELTNTDESMKFNKIIYIGSLFNNYDLQVEGLVKRISSVGAYVGIHLMLLGDRLGDFPKSIKDNIPARLEFNKYSENKAVFIFKERFEIDNHELDSKNVSNYLVGLN